MEGRYSVKALAHELGTAGTGTPQIGVLCRIIGGPHDGQTHTWYGFFTQETVQRTLESLRCFGWTGSDITELKRDGFGSELAEGTFGEEEDKGTGELRTRLNWINSAGVAMKNVMDKDSAKALARRVAQYIERGKDAAPLGSKASAPGGKPRSDDDIPF